MGKNSEKNKKQLTGKSSYAESKLSKAGENSPRAYDKDTVVFIAMSQELKDEGNKLFQKRDYEGAMLKYEKALKLLPGNHIDVSYLHSNMAACYMQLGISEYPRAIHECNLALEVTPKYSKALLKRARCYEALNRLDLALRDVGTVLKMEPNNIMATEIAERVEKMIERNGSREGDDPVDLIPVPEYFEPPSTSLKSKVVKEKARKKRKNVKEQKVDANMEEKKVETENDKKNRNDRTEVKRKNVKEQKVDANMEEKKVETESGEKKRSEKTEEKRKNVNEQKVDVNMEDKKVETVSDEKSQNKKTEEKKAEVEVTKTDDQIEEKNAEDKLVVQEEKISNGVEEEPKRTVKLVFDEDIRWAQIPLNCTILKLREIVLDRFPSTRGVLVKYRDQEGDLVTITSTEELRLAEASIENGSLKLYIVEVNPNRDPFFSKGGEIERLEIKQDNASENGYAGKGKQVANCSACINDWIIEFAQLFKNYVGFETDAYLDLHQVGMKLYSEAMEDTVTSEEAQDLFNSAAKKFQEMAALALFNWGNVHMSSARKRVYFVEDSSKESVVAQIRSGYEWAQNEYMEAGKRYEEALRIKPDFYEATLALGQQQFEHAKLSWYYAVGTNTDLESWPSTEVLQLYNNAEENMEKGMQLWEEAEEHRLNGLSKPNKIEKLLQKMNLDNIVKDMSPDEAAEQAANTKSQINVLWGTMLYERSIMEFKLGLPVWHECLEVAIEKFELAGASPTDINIMLKNHCSNDTALEGIGFHIDEIVQAWNEMHEAKRWQSSIPSFRLEPLLRRRVSKLYHALEHA